MIFKKLIARFSNKSVPSASTMARDPLRLDLQFFADPPDDDPNKQEPPNPDEDTPPTLAELTKQYPSLKTELKNEKAAAVSKRFKNYDFDIDEARAALREKKEREEKGEDKVDLTNDKIVSLTQKTNLLEGKTKALSVTNYAIANGLDPKLLVRLGKEQVDKLQLDDDYNLDSDELDEIVDGLREEFPALFTVAATPPADEDPIEDPVPPVSGFNSGSRQRTNTPPKGTGTDADALVADTLDRLRKSKRI